MSYEVPVTITNKMLGLVSSGVTSYEEFERVTINI